jgi:hypothetical protein
MAMLTDEVVDLLNERDTLRARVAELEQLVCDAALAKLEGVRDVLQLKFEAAYDLAHAIEGELAAPGAAQPADAAYAQGRLDERAEVCAWLRTLDRLELAKHIDQCTHTDWEPPGEGT